MAFSAYVPRVAEKASRFLGYAFAAKTDTAMASATYRTNCPLSWMAACAAMTD
jgi:hypothetical protein